MTDQGRIEYEQDREGFGNGHGLERERGAPRETQSVGSLVAELLGETSAFIQAEVALARSEIRHNVDSVRQGATAIGGGMGLLHAGLIVLLGAAVLLLDRFWATWVAAAVVGIAAVLIGGACIMYGKHKATREGITPGRTIGTLGEMRELARHEKARAMRKWQ